MTYKLFFIFVVLQIIEVDFKSNREFVGKGSFSELHGFYFIEKNDFHWSK